MTKRTKEDRVGRARSRAKRVIVALVIASEGRLIGKLRLYKAFYKAHIEYFVQTGMDLTGYPMVHMQNGPGIDNAQELIDELREEGLVTEEIGTPGRPKERVYKADRESEIDLDDQQKDAVMAAITWANSLDEGQLKEQSHNRSWQNTLMGEHQNIFQDVLSAEQFDALQSSVNRTVVALEGLANAS